jgi:NAD(P)-dependent dehydrogenase (short-subunit alcohol dehydrogenase family)
MRLKPLHQQVVAIFGASSGIGRETALRFARAGSCAGIPAVMAPYTTILWTFRR